MFVKRTRDGGVTITLNAVEAFDALSLLIASEPVVPAERTLMDALTARLVTLLLPEQPTPRTFARKGEAKFPCTLVDADGRTCKRETRTLSRSQVHATSATLQEEGHLPDWS